MSQKFMSEIVNPNVVVVRKDMALSLPLGRALTTASQRHAAEYLINYWPVVLFTEYPNGDEVYCVQVGNRAFNTRLTYNVRVTYKADGSIIVNREF